MTFKKSSSNEDLLHGSGRISAKTVENNEMTRQPIVAEFDMVRSNMSEGPNQKQRRRSHHRSHSQKVKKRATEDKDESFSCSIF